MHISNWTYSKNNDGPKRAEGLLQTQIPKNNLYFCMEQQKRLPRLLICLTIIRIVLYSELRAFVLYIIKHQLNKKGNFETKIKP